MSATQTETQPAAEITKLEEAGWQHLNAQRYDQALQEFDAALQLDPESEGAMQGRIATLRKDRLFSPAMQELELALAAHPASVGILSERAWLYYEQRDYPRAVDAFTAVLRVVPKSDDKIVWKSSLLRALRRFDEAEITLQAAERLLPESNAIKTERAWLCFDQQQYDLALRLFDDACAKQPKNDLTLQGKIGALRMKGNYDEARKLLRKDDDRLQKSPGLLSEEGWLNFEQGQYERAETSFRRIVKLQPNDVYSRINLAWALVWQGSDKDLEEASESCRTALQNDPHLTQAYGCLGVIAAKQGRLREAESNFNRSIILDDMRGRRGDLGALYVRMGRYEEAEQVLRKATEINRDDAHARVELGNLYLLTERTKDAIREYSIARALDPGHPAPPRALAIALLESGKLFEAEKVLREAIRALDQSKRWQLHLTLCQVLTHVGDETGELTYYRDALNEANAAIRLRDTQAEPYFSTGIVRYKLGDLAGALKDFRRCTQRDERHLEADLNARRIEALLRTEARSRVGRRESYSLAIVFLLQVFFLWTVYLRSTKISERALLVILPIVLMLVLVSILLPWLNRLKLKGLEADLAEVKPKETLASGPKGEVGFDSALASMIGR